MTPVRQQYLSIKKQFPETIVFFRLGDFYETFDDDARIVSQVCQIVLTGREMGAGERIPLAGVPYHAAENYLAKLIQAGHKVAIVEQQEGSAAPGRTLMPREVKEVVTPIALYFRGMARCILAVTHAVTPLQTYSSVRRLCQAVGCKS